MFSNAGHGTTQDLLRLDLSRRSRIAAESLPRRSAQRGGGRNAKAGEGGAYCNPATYSATALISSSVRRAASARMTCARSLLRAPLLKSVNCCTV